MSEKQARFQEVAKSLIQKITPHMPGYLAPFLTPLILGSDKLAGVPDEEIDKIILLLKQYAQYIEG